MLLTLSTDAILSIVIILVFGIIFYLYKITIDLNLIELRISKSSREDEVFDKKS